MFIYLVFFQSWVRTSQYITPTTWTHQLSLLLLLLLLLLQLLLLLLLVLLAPRGESAVSAAASFAASSAAASPAVARCLPRTRRLTLATLPASLPLATSPAALLLASPARTSTPTSIAAPSTIAASATNAHTTAGEYLLAPQQHRVAYRSQYMQRSEHQPLPTSGFARMKQAEHQQTLVRIVCEIVAEYNPARKHTKT